MSHFGRVWIRAETVYPRGFPRRFQMFSYPAHHRTRQLRLKFPLLFNYQLSWGDNLGFQLTAKRREERLLFLIFSPEENLVNDMETWEVIVATCLRRASQENIWNQQGKLKSSPLWFKYLSKRLIKAHYDYIANIAFGFPVTGCCCCQYTCLNFNDCTSRSFSF